MFSDNEPSCLSAHLSFSVINVKEDSFLMVHITHVPGKFLPRNNLHLLSSVCLCGLFHSGVIYCSSISLALISHSSDWDVIFFSPPLRMSAPWKLKVFVAQRVTSSALPSPFYLVIYLFIYLRACSSFQSLESLPLLFLRRAHRHKDIQLSPCCKYETHKNTSALDVNFCRQQKLCC